MHTARFLPARTLGPTQRERGTRMAAHGGRRTRAAAHGGRDGGRWDGAGVQPRLPERAGSRPNGCGQQRGGTRVMGCDVNGWRREAGLGKGNRCRLCASVGRRRQRWGAAWRAPWERAAAQGRGSVGAGRAQAVSASVHRLTRCIGVGGSYSLKLASIAATRSFSASMSCWFTSSIFCKSAREAFST